MVNEQGIQTDITELAQRAKAAFEQKRMRECIALTQELALADPGNEEAKSLEAAIRSEFQQDLYDVRALLEQSGSKEERRKYHRAAEIILLKILNLAPDNAEAKMLLQSARAQTSAPIASPVQHSYEQNEELAPWVVASPPAQGPAKGGRKDVGLKFSIGIVGVIILGGGIVHMLQSRPSKPSEQWNPPPQAAHFEPIDLRPASPKPPSAVHSDEPAPATSIPEPVPVVKAPAPVTSAQATTPARPGVTTLAPSDAIPKDKPKPPAVSTPKPPAQLTVQINARPWAQVFLDGPTRKALGQTPLSGVAVPVGGVLVFENPNFASKTHRITDTDAAIQVNFP
jgi:hypothetical protein